MEVTDAMMELAAVEKKSPKNMSVENEDSQILICDLARSLHKNGTNQSIKSD